MSARALIDVRRSQRGLRDVRRERAFSSGPPVARLNAGREIGQRAPWVGHDVRAGRSLATTTPAPNACRSQRVEVDEAVQRRVGGVEHLKATVEQKAVDLVGPDPSADGVARLEHDDVEPGVAQTSIAQLSPASPAPTMTTSWCCIRPPRPDHPAWQSRRGRSARHDVPVTKPAPTPSLGRRRVGDPDRPGSTPTTSPSEVAHANVERLRDVIGRPPADLEERAPIVTRPGRRIDVGRDRGAVRGRHVRGRRRRAA